MFDNIAQSYYVNTTDSSTNLLAISALFTNIQTINILANDSRIIDGKTLKVRLICDFSKSIIANSTLEFQCIIGGITFTFPTFTTGGAIIPVNSQTIEIDLDINFRTANQARVMGRFSRSSNGTNLNWLTTKPALGTFNKTINNSISFGWRIVATANNITLQKQQAQALLF